MRLGLFALLSISLSVATAGAQTPLIAHWTFDETSGLVANDSGPFANHGTLTNVLASQMPWVPGVFGNAISVDGIDDYVDFALNGGLPFYEGLGAAFSVCFWVKAAPQDDDRVLSLSSALSNDPLFTLGSGGTGANDKLRVFIRNDVGATIAAPLSDAVVFDSTWHHVAYVDVAGNAHVWVDGILDTGSFDYRFSFRGPRSSAYGTLTMDQVSVGTVTRSSPCCHLTAEIDDLRIYGFALSEADVAAVIGNVGPSVCRGSIGEFGVGCGPGPLELIGAGSPVLGGSGLLLVMRNGTPNTFGLMCTGAGAVTPLDLGPLGLPGCRAYLPGSPNCFGVGILSPFGSSGATAVNVPNSPSLACLQFVFQGVAIGGVASAFDLSNAVIVQLGQ